MSGRPKEYEDLRNTTLSLEREIVDRCKETNINISSVCRDALIKVIDDPILRKKYDKFSKIDKETLVMVHKVYKDTKNLSGCLRIIRRNCGISVGQMEFLNWFERYDKKVGD